MSSKRASAIVPFSTNAVRFSPKKLVPVLGIMSPAIDICICATAVNVLHHLQGPRIVHVRQGPRPRQWWTVVQPVGHNEALEAELAFEDLDKNTVILTGKGIVDKVWHEETGSIYARH